MINAVDSTQRSRAWNDSKVSAHHGIIPTLEPFRLQALSEKERLVYEVIRGHYLAQFLPHHEFDRTSALFKCGGEQLQALGKQVVIPGWRDALGNDPDTSDEASEQRSQVLPALSPNTLCSVQHAEMRTHNTLPPKAFTQGELVKAMKGVAKLITDPRLKQKLKETTGIGTEATRANIINGLLSRGYLFKQGRSVRASEAAFTLIDAVPPAIADPGTTAIWEQALDMIESGQMTLDEFITKQASWITQLVEHYRTTTLSIRIPEGPNCPLCGTSMRQRAGKNGLFWSCTRYPECRGTLPVEARNASSSGTRKPRRSRHKND
jgi:DNA topoisomerase-3